MRRVALLVGVPILLGLGWGLHYAWNGIPIGLGFAAKMVCSFSFVGGREPSDIFERYVSAEISPLGPATSISVDRAARRVEASILGLLKRSALHREGLGCTLLVDGAPQTLLSTKLFDPRLAALAQRPPITGRPWPVGRSQPLTPGPAALALALDAAFAEPGGPLRQTTAVVVVHRGRLVAERYALGFDAKTRMISWSMAKSVTGALIGVAAKRGLLEIAAPAPVAAWRGAGDPRAAITLDQLLRMSSGLVFEEVYSPPRDAPRMLYREPDMGAFGASRPLGAPPDSVWNYSSGTTNVLMRILRERLGGLQRVWHFAFTHLFGPVGMTTAVFEPDESGTYVGSSYLWASARDWARFGELFLRDGVWDGRRVLPSGWVAYSTTPTRAAPKGEYGAHWWLNAGANSQRSWQSLPPEVYSARGYSGQYVMVVPSHELVIVRLGLSRREADHGMEPLARAAIDWADTGGR